MSRRGFGSKEPVSVDQVSLSKQIVDAKRLRKRQIVFLGLLDGAGAVCFPLFHYLAVTNHSFFGAIVGLLGQFLSIGFMFVGTMRVTKIVGLSRRIAKLGKLEI